MLGPRVRKLLAIASNALASSGAPDLPTGPVFDELAELLRERNGFYAFESALHVFGSGTNVKGRSLDEWNVTGGWRAAYGGMADELLFFAEDIFGGQFAIRNDQVVTFNPETGQVEPIASSIEMWSDHLIARGNALTGFPVAHAWQQVNGAIEPGNRLVPKRPFVLGGVFEPANVYSLDAVKGMRLRGDLALQIRNVPDGAMIRYKIVP